MARFARGSRICSATTWALKEGGLMSYGESLRHSYVRTAYYLEQIAKKPEELPVEQPTKFELIINLKTAQALGPYGSKYLARSC